MKKIILLLMSIGILFGCSDNPVAPENVEATIYYRSVGTGTVKLEFYTFAEDDTYYRNLLYELTEASLAINIVANDEIIPLAIGNRWTYDIKVFDSGGTAIYTDVDSSWVDRDTTINDQLWFILMDEDGPLQLAVNADDGYWARNVFATGSVIDSVGEAYLSAKYPVNEGDSYTNYNSFETYVEATNVSVTVPAGVYNSIQYKRTEQ